MKIRNKDEKVIKCAYFKEIAVGECFCDERYNAIMMKINPISAVNLSSGISTQYGEKFYAALVDAEVVWEFKKE